MRKLFTLVCALAVALSLSVPAFAKKKDKAAPKKAEAATAKEHGKKKGAAKAEAATSEEHGKAHEEHAQKKGADEGKKAGQQETSPAPEQ